MITVTVYRDRAGQWRWRTQAANGEIMAESGEGYARRAYAEEMALRLAPDEAVSVVTDDTEPET